MTENSRFFKDVKGEFSHRNNEREIEIVNKEDFSENAEAFRFVEGMEENMESREQPITQLHCGPEQDHQDHILCEAIVDRATEFRQYRGMVAQIDGIDQLRIKTDKITVEENGTVRV